MSQKIYYRKATTKDANHMIVVHFKAVHAISAEHYPEEVLKAWSPKPNKDRENWLAEVILKPNSDCFVATNGTEQIVAFAIYLKQSQTIQALYVAPNEATMGIGTSLLAMMESSAVSSGANKLKLKASINAVDFYHTMGFHKIKNTVQVLSDGRFMSAVLMEKQLH